MSDEDGFFSECQIAIVGLGLMGGSLALALAGHCRTLYGVDPNPQAIALAKQASIFKSVVPQLADLPSEVNALILAAPISASLGVLTEVPEQFPDGLMVMDLCSTKSDLLKQMQALPPHFDPIGGHPICGKEKLGFENADKDLFRHAIFVITALERSSSRVQAFAEELVTITGAVPLWYPSEAHDAALARTSHLPFLVASALVAATAPEFVPFIGSGFASTARIAATPSSMMLDVLKTNRQEILSAASEFMEQMTAMMALLEQENFDELETWLDKNAGKMNGFMKTIHERKVQP